MPSNKPKVLAEWRHNKAERMQRNAHLFTTGEPSRWSLCGGVRERLGNWTRLRMRLRHKPFDPHKCLLCQEIADNRGHHVK